MPESPIDTRNRTVIRGSKWRRRSLRALLLLLSLPVSLFAVELGLRLLAPVEIDVPGFERKHYRETSDLMKQVYVADKDLGLRPIAGSSLYGEHGALINRHRIAKEPGTHRILLVGDSVTARPQYSKALEGELDAGQEQWNAGVEGFNTVQVALYYSRFLESIAADRVIYTFHNNDFENTPVAYTTTRTARSTSSSPRKTRWP